MYINRHLREEDMYHIYSILFYVFSVAVLRNILLRDVLIFHFYKSKAQM